MTIYSHSVLRVKAKTWKEDKKGGLVAEAGRTPGRERERAVTGGGVRTASGMAGG